MAQKYPDLWHEDKWDAPGHWSRYYTYRQTFDISRPKSQNINVSRLILQMSLSNPLKPGAQSSMKI